MVIQPIHEISMPYLYLQNGFRGTKSCFVCFQLHDHFHPSPVLVSLI